MFPDRSSVIYLTLGALLNLCLLGALTVQVYHYIIDYPKDRWYNKLLVTAVCLVDCTQTALVLTVTYRIIDPHLGGSVRQDTIITVCQAFLTGIVAFMVQSFYAIRIYFISQKKWIAAMIISWSSVSLILRAAILAIVVVTNRPLKAYAVTVSMYAVTSVCDASIAAIMISSLLRSGTEISSMHWLLKIGRLAFGTNALTAAAVLTSLILYAGFPNRAYHSVISFSLCMWYSNALLTQLNERPPTIDNEVTIEFTSFQTRLPPESKQERSVVLQQMGTGSVSHASGDSSEPKTPTLLKEGI